MVKKIVLFLIVSQLFAVLSMLQAKGGKVVTLSIPESVLREAVKQSLPVEIDTSSQSIEGRVFVRKIDNLQLDDQRLSALLVLSGQKVNIATNIGGHTLRLNVGDVDVECRLSALVRYEQASTTLFVKPQVSEYNSSGNKQSNELGNLLVALLNGREFPLKVEKLQPLITDLGNKQLAVDLAVQDITITEGMMNFSLTPAFQTFSPKQKQ